MSSRVVSCLIYSSISWHAWLFHCSAYCVERVSWHTSTCRHSWHSTVAAKPCLQTWDLLCITCLCNHLLTPMVQVVGSSRVARTPPDDDLTYEQLFWRNSYSEVAFCGCNSTYVHFPSGLQSPWKKSWLRIAGRQI